MRRVKFTSEAIDYHIENLRVTKVVLDRCLAQSNLTFGGLVSQYYLKEQSVTQVARILNENGHRLKSRKYLSTDIGEIIRSERGLCGRTALALLNFNSAGHGGTSQPKLFREIKKIYDEIGELDELC